MTNIQFFRKYRFEAARRLGGIAKDHRTSRLHGHSFVLTAAIHSEKQNEDIVFAELDKKMHPLFASLDYQYLNESIPLENPTSSNLLKWAHEQARLDDSVVLELQDTKKNVRMADDGRFQFSQEFILHSAHFLPNVPEGHKCGRLHGHNFKIILTWEGDPEQELLEYEQLLEQFQPLYEQLHCRLLNDIDGLENPTSENLSAWLWKKLKTVIPLLVSVTVYETNSVGSSYTGKLWDCFKEFSMDSAILGEYGPMGHTYVVRLCIQGTLDATMGWTRDFGEIKDSFQPYYKELDHHPLHQVNGLNATHLPTLADWIYEKVAPQIPELYRIQIADTENSGIWYQMKCR
ncbi:MAG: 6-carboxytetrahydropterin synthase [SAR324 cluster bacterium]|nr:6-carboxytetrahydropterin synthase [SAR324 cluster bacterium]